MYNNIFCKKTKKEYSTQLFYRLQHERTITIIYLKICVRRTTT